MFYFDVESCLTSQEYYLCLGEEFFILSLTFISCMQRENIQEPFQNDKT